MKLVLEEPKGQIINCALGVLANILWATDILPTFEIDCLKFIKKLCTFGTSIIHLSFIQAYKMTSFKEGGGGQRKDDVGFCNRAAQGAV